MSSNSDQLSVVMDARSAKQEHQSATLESLRRCGVDAAAVQIFTGGELPNCSAPFVLWIEAGVVLEPSGLVEILGALERFPDTDLLYTDDAEVRRPAYSPVRLRTQDYLGGARVFRRSAFEMAQLESAAPVGAEAHAWALSVARGRSAVTHLPLRAYRPGPLRPVDSDALLAVATHELKQLGLPSSVTADDGIASVCYAIADEPLISIIIPTRGSAADIAGERRVLVTEAVSSILTRSNYGNIEFVVVADDVTPQDVVDELRDLAGDALRLVRWSEPFSFSGKINRGALFAEGDYLLLLNDDVEVASPGWIEGMLGLAQQPGVGMVGSLLYFEDGTIQHAGHLYRDGGAGHIALGWLPEWQDRLRSLSVEREVSGVTAACAMVPTDDFWAVGGFSTLFPSNYNDVDFCMKLRALGRSVLWTPKARLYHFESKTRVPTIAHSETVTLHRRWESLLQRDAFWPDQDD